MKTKTPLSTAKCTYHLHRAETLRARLDRLSANSPHRAALLDRIHHHLSKAHEV